MNTQESMKQRIELASAACEEQLKRASTLLAAGDIDGHIAALDAAANWSSVAFRTAERLRDANGAAAGNGAAVDPGIVLARRGAAGVITVTTALPVQLCLSDDAARGMIEQLQVALAIDGEAEVRA